MFLRFFRFEFTKTGQKIMTQKIHEEYLAHDTPFPLPHHL